MMSQSSSNERIAELEAKVEAAEALAGGVRSFLSSLPFIAPEAIGFQVQVKLAQPLEHWENS